MKTINRLYLLAVTAAALSLNATTGLGQVFNAKDVINNRAVANSPRTKEAAFAVAGKGRATRSRAGENCAADGRVSSRRGHAGNAGRNCLPDSRDEHGNG